MNPILLKRAGLIGSPVAHSLSPAIFQFIANHEEVPFEYEAKDLKQSELASFLSSLKEMPSMVGLNVTIPHKEQVAEFLDEVSAEARALGAINVIHKEGTRLKGLNTDVIGIQASLNEKNFNARDANVFLYGAGGSAKAVAWVLGSKKARELVIFNPRSDRGQKLATQFQSLFPETRFRSIQSIDEVKGDAFSLIVNSTPVGMKAADDPTFFDSLSKLTFAPHALAFDLIYAPEETLFIRAATRHSIKTLGGLDTLGGLSMLIEQACASFEIWVGPLKTATDWKPKLALVLRGILELRKDSSPLFLTGFMGVGKSAVARALAKLTGRTSYDTDQMIESKVKMNVSEIFSKLGEKEFRRLERETLEEAAKLKQAVVALGGGALLDQDNLKTVKHFGTLVYLKAEEKTILERVAKRESSRPILAGLSSDARAQKVHDLMVARAPIYEQAHHSVSADSTVQNVTEAILAQIGVGAA